MLKFLLEKMQEKILIIGAGNMGGAIFQALAQSKFAQGLSLCDRDFLKMEALGKKVLQATGSDPAGNFFTSANDCLESAQVVLLAIKPQGLESFAAECGQQLAGKILISILAGKNLATLQEHFPKAKVCRAMPNLAAAVGRSLTGFFFGDGLKVAERKMIEKILQTFGQAVHCESERQIDQITALAGSGPAYFFHLVEILERVAGKFGFAPELAGRIAAQTFVGAAHAFENGGKSAGEFVQAVASPGGTTQAALESLQENDFERIFTQAIFKADERAGQISQGQK